MECDVIPDCSQESDPLGNLGNCDSLSDESCSGFGGSLNAQLITSSSSGSGNSGKNSVGGGNGGGESGESGGGASNVSNCGNSSSNSSSNNSNGCSENTTLIQASSRKVMSGGGAGGSGVTNSAGSVKPIDGQLKTTIKNHHAMTGRKITVQTKGTPNLVTTANSAPVTTSANTTTITVGSRPSSTVPSPTTLTTTTTTTTAASSAGTIKTSIPNSTATITKPPLGLPTSNTSSNTTAAATATAQTTQASTMREVLASIPGFHIKPRRRSNKKMSTAAQLEQTREGCIDLETPDSILVGTNLRDLLNRHTFSLLPPLYQYKLIQLLPDVDRPTIDSDTPTIRLNASSLNNEFFARACLEWRERLSEGEFTPENQLKIRSDAEKEKSKLDPWKLKHFEPIWGDSGQSKNRKLTEVGRKKSLSASSASSASSSSSATVTTVTMTTAATAAASTEPTQNYTTHSGRLVKSPTSYSSSNAQKRQRTVGAVTRSSAAAVSIPGETTPTKTQSPVPDLLPLRTKTPKQMTSSASPIHPSMTISNQTETKISAEMSIVRSIQSDEICSVQSTQSQPSQQSSMTITQSTQHQHPFQLKNQHNYQQHHHQQQQHHHHQQQQKNHHHHHHQQHHHHHNQHQHQQNNRQDIAIIATTINSSSSNCHSEKKIPYRDLKPDIELIPIPLSQSTATAAAPAAISSSAASTTITAIPSSLSSSGSISVLSSSAAASSSSSQSATIVLSSSSLASATASAISTSTSVSTINDMIQCSSVSISPVVQTTKITRKRPVSPDTSTTKVSKTSDSTTVSSLSDRLATISKDNNATATAVAAPKGFEDVKNMSYIKMYETDGSGSSVRNVVNRNDDNIQIISKMTCKTVEANSGSIATCGSTSVNRNVDGKSFTRDNRSIPSIGDVSVTERSLIKCEPVTLATPTESRSNRSTPILDDLLTISSDQKQSTKTGSVSDRMIANDDQAIADANNSIKIEQSEQSGHLAADIQQQQQQQQLMYDGDGGNVDIDLDSIKMDSGDNSDGPPPMNSAESCSSEYSNDLNDLNSGGDMMQVTVDKFDSNLNSNETDSSLTSFCADNIKLENIYKIQNFEGVLQIQPNSLTLEHRISNNDVDSNIDEDLIDGTVSVSADGDCGGGGVGGGGDDEDDRQSGLSTFVHSDSNRLSSMMMISRNCRSDGAGGDILIGGGGTDGGSGGIGSGSTSSDSGSSGGHIDSGIRGGVCDDSSSNSTTAALADCSGENSVDTAVEELEPSIQNLEPLEDDPIDQKFTDAENYVLESGEMSGDSGEASLPVDRKPGDNEEDIQAKMFAEAMARAFDNVPGNVPVAMTVVNASDNPEVNHLNFTSSMNSAQSINESVLFASTTNPTTSSINSSKSTLSGPIIQSSQSSRSILSSSKVIPMQETLEVRLKESTYQVITTSDWPTYSIKNEIDNDLPSGSGCSGSGTGPITMESTDDFIIESSPLHHIFKDELDESQSSHSIQSDQHQHHHHHHYQQQQQQQQLQQQQHLQRHIPKLSQSQQQGQQQSLPIYSTSSQVKLELEVTLTPETEVSSTVVSNSNNSCDSDQSNDNDIKLPTILPSNNVPTVIPPTTIVCLPSLVTVPNAAISPQPVINIQQSSLTYATSGGGGGGISNISAQQATSAMQQKRFVPHGGAYIVTANNNNNNNNSNNSSNSSNTARMTAAIVTQHQQQQQQQQQQSRTAVVASSSSIPYLSIATTQPLRAVPNTTQSRPLKFPTKSGRGNRTNSNRPNSNRPPPGAVNLERSYQICQAVIQSSPNRHQLKAHLKPPSALIGSTPNNNTTGTTTMTTTNNSKKEENVSSTIKANGQQRIGFTKKGFGQHRQPSPVLVRHVFTTNQGIPVSMAVLPSNVNQHQSNTQSFSNSNSNSSNSSSISGGGSNSNSSTGSSQSDSQLISAINPAGQYILVQRTGIVPGDNHAPRASSAPPTAQNQQGVTGNALSGRGRPASVDVDNHNSSGSGDGGGGAGSNDIQHYVETSSDGQTINRKMTNQGFVYSDNINMDTSYYSVSGENTPPNCACSLNAMVICQQCGVFCHDECMGSTKLCLSCVIR